VLYPTELRALRYIFLPYYFGSGEPRLVIISPASARQCRSLWANSGIKMCQLTPLACIMKRGL
jgi:hypothetical protein